MYFCVERSNNVVVDDELYTSKDKSDYGRYTLAERAEPIYDPDHDCDVVLTTIFVAATARCA